ncbi:MAG: hypothetical protein HRU35_04700 [Rickettsiaceae bacterium]|nr:hypothetical protein [Rickettsiaceae bacterium]
MLLLDFLLLMMIIICVVYCWILNRRIYDLQNSRMEFARMIKELNSSISKAESNVNEMSQLSKLTNAEIKTAIDQAKDTTIELMTITDIANDMYNKIANQSQKIRNKMDVIDENNNSLNKKISEKFTDEDLAVSEEEVSSNKYANQLKNFIQTIVSKKNEDSANLSGLSYYDTLRKINAKK